MNAAAPSIRDDLTAAASAGAVRPPMNKAHAVELARAILSPTKAAGPDYPIEGLGPLKHACLAISEGGQVRPAMAGQCLLGAASLLTQGLWNVDSLTGSKPLSLYALTLGDSGDGKSTAQEAALRPVTSWQRDVARRYSEELREFERAKASRKRGDDPVEMPSLPFRLVGDATVEGLRRDLDTGPCSQGVFSDEAAAILSGYGMSQDHRAKTAGVFSKLWDAGHLSVSRVTGGRVERYGRRLALHWLIQPMAAAESIGDPLLSALGFWPRFLLSWPEAALPRRARPFRPEELPEVVAYWDRCSELLKMPLPAGTPGREKWPSLAAATRLFLPLISGCATACPATGPFGTCCWRWTKTRWPRPLAAGSRRRRRLGIGWPATGKACAPPCRGPSRLAKALSRL